MRRPSEVVVCSTAAMVPDSRRNDESQSREKRDSESHGTHGHTSVVGCGPPLGAEGRLYEIL